MQLTVCIATWNRAGLLEQTLASLTRLRVPDGVGWEILVCDNNSRDHTRKVVESFTDRLPVRYLFEDRQGKSYALNRMIQQATGQWMLFTDDDVLVEPDWLEAYLAEFKRYPQAVCLGGPVHPWIEKPVRGRKAFLLKSYPVMFALLEVDHDTPMAVPDQTAYGANMAVRRDAVPDGGFDTRMGPCGKGRVSGEEVDLIRRILDQGQQAWIVTGPRVRHYVYPSRLTLRWIWQRQKAVGGEWAVQRGRPTPGKFGVPWWAWKELARRALRMCGLWRPWYTPQFLQALSETAQYLGYIRAP